VSRASRRSCAFSVAYPGVVTIKSPDAMTTAFATAQN
jgi:hypothetical protein